MSIEEKLQKCIEFIRGIEHGDKELTVCVSADDPNVHGDFQCDECGSRDIIGSTHVNVTGISRELRDKAWHLLFDIDSL